MRYTGFIDKKEHAIEIIVNTTCIISMFIKIVSIHDTESVNVPKNSLGLYEVCVMLMFQIMWCNMLTRSS